MVIALPYVRMDTHYKTKRISTHRRQTTSPRAIADRQTVSFEYKINHGVGWAIPFRSEPVLSTTFRRAVIV